MNDHMKIHYSLNNGQASPRLAGLTTAFDGSRGAFAAKLFINAYNRMEVTDSTGEKDKCFQT